MLINKSPLLSRGATTGVALFLAVLSAVPVRADNCYLTGHNHWMKRCRSGYSEIYREQRKSDGAWESMCCVTGSSDESSRRIYADECIQAACASKDRVDQEDQCDVGIPNHRYVNGKKLNFVEVVRDQCKDDQGQVGVKVLCCPDDSMDALLTTLYGAEPLEFPHFAEVGEYGCGGTVYNEQWILTAAHCVANEETRKTQTLEEAGEHEWKDCCAQVRINVEIRAAYTENTYNVTEIWIHPNSSYLQPVNHYDSYNDVALLKLDRPIKFGKNVKALRIAEPGFDPLKYGDRVIIVGFGTTDTLRGSQKQQKANLLIRKKDDVGLLWNRHDQLMFVGGIQGGTVSPSVGKGDSGGPAICRDAQGLAVLCGVTSLIASSTDNCKAHLDEANCPPSAYNDVQYFNDWIQSVAGSQDNAVLLQQPLFGEAVKENEFPAHVHIISMEGKPSCGGTLVAEDVVLTAASCVIESDGTARQHLKVVTGVMDAKGRGKTIDVLGSGPMQDFKLGSGVRNRRVVSLVLESWQKGTLDTTKIVKDPYYSNNLAFVKLAEKVGSGSKVAQLAKTSPKAGEMATEVAYPYKPLGTAAQGKIPLSKRQFEMLDKADCQKRVDRLSIIGYNVQLEGNIMCGVESYSGGSLCDRELGGGLYCQGPNGQQVLCGVQTFRLCEFNIPNAFMDVGSLNPWLGDVVKSMKS